MGSGKTSAVITYLNEHSDKKYVYITPYLDEANRIKKECPGLRFVEPSNKISKYNFKKSLHTAALIKEGRNIATTHQAFKGYTSETLSDICEQGYTLIIDENVDVLEMFDFHPDDLQIAIDAGYVTEQDGLYTIANSDYDGTALRDIFRLLESRELIKMTDRNDTSILYWALPAALLTSFSDVFILTYLFKGQSLRYFMDIHKIEYEYIGVERNEDGVYHFCDHAGIVPGYVKNLRDMIHILSNDKLNSIGKSYYALSMNWFKTRSEEVQQLKRNIYNYFNNIFGSVDSKQKMWGTYSNAFGKIKGKGYTKAFLPFNIKAINTYKNRNCLVYAVNIFMNVNEKKFYQMHNIKIDDDLYALSTMIQWIWRSSIRDGNEIYIYIPSKRMRALLIDWIDTVSKGGGAIEK